MNISTTAYNPFTSAAQAAIAELVSDQAQRFYALQGQKDVQSALDNALTLIGWVYQLSEMAYRLGALSRAWCDEMIANSEAPAIPCGTAKPNASSFILCPAATSVALLPAAQPSTIRLPGALASSGVAIVTPAPATDEPVPVEVIEVVSPESGAETIAPPQPGTKPRQRRAPSGKQKAPTTPARSRRKPA
jgi:hypothetical protein